MNVHPQVLLAACFDNAPARLTRPLITAWPFAAQRAVARDLARARRVTHDVFRHGRLPPSD